MAACPDLRDPPAFNEAARHMKRADDKPLKFRASTAWITVAKRKSCAGLPGESDDIVIKMPVSLSYISLQHSST